MLSRRQKPAFPKQQNQFAFSPQEDPEELLAMLVISPCAEVAIFQADGYVIFTSTIFCMGFQGSLMNSRLIAIVINGHEVDPPIFWAGRKPCWTFDLSFF